MSKAGLEAAASDARVGCVMDCPHANAPLVIAFGCMNWDTLPMFDFFGRTKKLEVHVGQPINRILLRDVSNLWYQRGCAGLGSNAQDLSDALALMVSSLSPTSIFIVGQNMGGYAALQFGMTLQRCFGHERFGRIQVLAFGPLSYLNAQRAQADGDRRYLPMMQTLARVPPLGFIDDLAGAMAQSAATGTLPKCCIVMGTGNAPPQGDNIDSIHAERFASIAGVELLRFDQAPHAVVHWLLANKDLDAVMQHAWLSADPSAGTYPHPQASGDTSLAPSTLRTSLHPQLQWHGASDGSHWVSARIEGFAETPTITESWHEWVAENLLLGNSRMAAIHILTEHGFSGADAVLSIENSLRSPLFAVGKRLSARVAKRDWTLDVLRRNAATAPPNPANSPVPVVDGIDSQTFLHHHYAAGRPLAIRGAMAHWPALHKWTLGYLRQTAGEAQVQVQAGREANPQFEIQAPSHVREMRFADFLDQVAQVEGRDPDSPGGRSNDFYITARNASSNMEALAALWPDVGPLAQLLHPQLGGHEGYFWMGPRGTFTPLHHDLTNNLMAQVRGRKRVWLVSPLYTPFMYNYLHCFSEVDLRAIDLQRHPLMQNVPVIEYVLQPSELLFLPVGWWHQVESLDTSITMTYTNFLWPNDYATSYSTYGPV